jgi:branched-chain amino acid transport system permease protein
MKVLLSPGFVLGGFGGFFAILPLFANDYVLYVGNVTAIYVILAIAMNITIGHTGLLSFVNGALFGVGAYTTAILKSWVHLPYVIALPSSAIAALIIGLLIALPALRLSGLYLAMATVAFAQTALWVFLHWDPVTGGATGIQVAPVAYPVSRPDVAHYYVSLVVATLVVVLSSSMLRSRIGRAFVAIRESEVAAESLAIDLVRFKTLAYAISAMLAGLAGGLFAPLLGLVVPETYDMAQVIVQLAMAVVGGLGSVAGSVLGAIILVWMQEWLRAFKELQEIAFGGMILLTILFMPGGVAGLLRKWVPAWRETFHRKSYGSKP